jgi:predicted nucleic acid-binding protein
MISFDTNILVYATASGSDAKTLRARDLIARAMRSGWAILLLQTLAEFAHVAIRRTIDARRAVLPIQAADDGDLTAALEAVRAHRLPFWDAMLWASAQRAGVRCLLTEDCPSSDDLRLIRRLANGCSGSSGLEFKRPAVDAASDGLRWSAV